MQELVVESLVVSLAMRIRGDDARDLRQDPPAEFVTAHSESTTLGVRQAKRPRAQVFSEDPILLPEIVDQIVLVTVHPASEREDEELQRRRHSLTTAVGKTRWIVAAVISKG